MRRIKRWVVYDEEYPKGLVFDNRYDALDYSEEVRESGSKAYTRIKYYTQQELEALPEAD